jgi:hypothetical protein
MMKKSLSFVFLFFVLSVSLYGGEINYTMEFSPQELSFSVLGDYDIVRLKGCVQMEETGLPSLPARYVSFIIPADAKVVGVKIESSMFTPIPGVYNIFPAQKPIPFSTRKKFLFSEPKKEIYSSYYPYPEKTVEYIRTGNLCGYRLAVIRVYPVRYIPAEKEIKLLTAISFTVTYENGLNPTGPVSSLQKSIFSERVKKMVVNPEEVKMWGPASSRQLDVEPVYYIITDPSFVSGFEPLRDWKTKKGVPAEIVTTDWIYSNYSGVDNPDKIRNFIKARADSGGLWFLLGGQCDHEHGEEFVPRRDAWFCEVGAGGYPDEDTIPCDLYYADLDGTWDGNGNGTYGEFGDGIDMYADVYVGRAPVKTIAQVNDFVNKVLIYEKTPPAGYAKRIMLPAVQLFWILLHGFDWYGSTVNNAIADILPSDWTVVELYDDNLFPSWGLHQATIDSMNSGFGFCHHADHGNEDGHYYLFGSVVYDYSDADAATNGDRYTIINAISCFTGAIDENSGGGNGNDCIGEHYVERVGNGCVASIMNTRYGLGAYNVMGASEVLDTTFYYETFQQNRYHIGEAHAASRDDWASMGSDTAYRWCIYELTLFGDPEMPMWRDEPKTLTVSHPSVIGEAGGGPDTFTVDVSSSTDAPVEGAIVTTMQDSTVYEIDTTNSSGTATVVIDPVNEGIADITVTAYHQDFKPYEGTGQISPSVVNEKPSYNKPLTFSLIAVTPVREKSNISYSIPFTTRVSIVIYDVAGRKVKTLVDASQKPGRYNIVWDGKDFFGNRRTNGVYFVSMETRRFCSTRKIVMFR